MDIFQMLGAALVLFLLAVACVDLVRTDRANERRNHDE